MLNTRQKVLRNFWYATLPTAALKDGPKPFRLLGEDVVLFLDEKGAPAALKTAAASHGETLQGVGAKDGIVCGYHGWEYDRAGRWCASPSSRRIRRRRTRARAFRAKDRYGYVWLCLGEPLLDIPDLPQENDPAFRRIHQFDEGWNCSALRMMENSFDNSHFSFVHKTHLRRHRPAKAGEIRND